MGQLIKHFAVVECINGDSVTVKTVQTSACAGCHAAGRCGLSESRDRLTVVPRPAFPVSIGEQVLLEARESQGWLAILLTFVLPLVVFVLPMILCIEVWQMNEYASSAIGFGALCIYFLSLLPVRKSLSKTLAFKIEKINTENKDI